MTMRFSNSKPRAADDQTQISQFLSSARRLALVGGSSQLAADRAKAQGAPREIQSAVKAAVQRASALVPEPRPCGPASSPNTTLTFWSRPNMRVIEVVHELLADTGGRFLILGVVDGSGAGRSKERNHKSRMSSGM